ncbi:MAG: hypothetical protein IKS00_04075 [Bacteroidales bacterium]|nr:hypothetical protein [Bacteroidales bacterium]
MYTLLDVIEPDILPNYASEPVQVPDTLTSSPADSAPDSSTIQSDEPSDAQQQINSSSLLATTAVAAVVMLILCFVLIAKYRKRVG